MTERLFLRLEGDPLYAPETGVPAGVMSDVAVSDRLRESISHITLYREAILSGHEVVERVVPDAAVRLIFHFGDLPAAGAGGGWRAGVVGAASAPVVLRLRGLMEGLTVTVRPGAVAGVVGVPASEIAPEGVSLDDLWGASGRDLAERMAAAPDGPTRAALVQQALRQRLQTAENVPHRQAALAAQLIAESGGRCRLRDVAGTVGVGERRLQQIFNTHVGLPPRTWSRLARLHACVRALRRQSAPRWAMTAVDAGFYDQSHLANEFQALCGLTPRQFFDRTISGSSKTAS